MQKICSFPNNPFWAFRVHEWGKADHCAYNHQETSASRLRSIQPNTISHPQQSHACLRPSSFNCCLKKTVSADTLSETTWSPSRNIFKTIYHVCYFISSTHFKKIEHFVCIVINVYIFEPFFLSQAFWNKNRCLFVWKKKPPFVMDPIFLRNLIWFMFFFFSWCELCHSCVMLV